MFNEVVSEEEYREDIAALADYVYGRIELGLNAACQNLPEPHLREITGSYLEHRGKCLRPFLLTYSCILCGGTGQHAEAAAAAVEMFHTWTLMHDDIIDHDDFRRGRPTAHVRGARLCEADLGITGVPAREYGQDVALLGGDVLHGLAADMLMQTDASPRVVMALTRRMCSKLTSELISGEQMDIRLSLTPWESISEDDIMQMMRLKTGALLAFCAEAGASIGQEDAYPDFSEWSQKLAGFAHECGLAFQMADDILGVFGEESTFGKPIGSDIREGKRTVLMLRTLKAASPEDKAKLLSILGREDATADEIALVRSIVEKTGARAAVEELSNQLVNHALSVLTEAFPVCGARRMLEAWARGMVARKV